MCDITVTFLFFCIRISILAHLSCCFPVQHYYFPRRIQTAFSPYLIPSALAYLFVLCARARVITGNLLLDRSSMDVKKGCVSCL